MSTIKVRALVIKTTDINESDKMLSVIAKDIGKISIYARGSRNAKSKFLTSSEIFAYSDFVLYDKNGKYSIVSTQLITNFYNIRLDYNKLLIASDCIKLINYTVLEGSPCNEIMKLTLFALDRINKNKNELIHIESVFNIKFMDLTGHGVPHGFCSKCNKDYSEFDYKVFFGDNGLLCNKCKDGYPKKILIDKTVVLAIEYINNSNEDEVFNFTCNQKSTELLNKCSHMLLENNNN